MSGLFIVYPNAALALIMLLYPMLQACSGNDGHAGLTCGSESSITVYNSDYPFLPVAHSKGDGTFEVTYMNLGVVDQTQSNSSGGSGRRLLGSKGATDRSDEIVREDNQPKDMTLDLNVIPENGYDDASPDVIVPQSVVEDPDTLDLGNPDALVELTVFRKGKKKKKALAMRKKTIAKEHAQNKANHAESMAKTLEAARAAAIRHQDRTDAVTYSQIANTI